MIDFLSGLFATFVTIPILVLVLSYYIAMAITGNKKRSFHRMIDVSTIFFIFAVCALSFVIWERSFIWLILLILLLLAVIVIVTHWKLSEEIKFSRFWKGYWRINFLLFFVSYVSLILYGLIHRIISL